MSRYTVRKFAPVTIASNIGSATIPSVGGEVIAVFVDYPAATCTVDINSTGEVVSQEILNLAAANTDVVIYPRRLLQDNTGVDLDPSDAQGGDTALYGKIAVFGGLTLTIAAGTNGQIVNVSVLMKVF